MAQSLARRARPQLIKALVVSILLIAGFVIARLGSPTSPLWREKLKAFGGSALVLVAGIVVVRLLASATRFAVERRRGDQRGAPLGLIVSGVGYLVLLIAVLSALQFKLGSLLLGGALTGVIIGIAAQQTLSNFFAGILLMVVRPFNVGDRVVLRSTLGEYEGVVRDINFFYVKLRTARGPVELPSSNVLTAAIGPGARSQDAPAAPSPGQPAEERRTRTP